MARLDTEALAFVPRDWADDVQPMFTTSMDDSGAVRRVPLTADRVAVERWDAHNHAWSECPCLTCRIRRLDVLRRSP